MVRKPQPIRAMRISLQHNGQVIRAVRSTEIVGEIQIGRSSVCAWQTPADEPDIGKKHAVLLIREGQLVLIDNNSANGTWLQDKRIKERALQPGDRIAIGHCELVVEPESPAKTATGTPQLTILSGKQRGQRFPIPSGSFSIGSSPDCDLVLLEGLVSKQHAVIARKADGSCSVKDLKSTNRTWFNEEPQPLRAEQERPLKEGDRIRVADIEILFSEGNGRRNQGQALRRLGILALVTLLTAGAYYGWQLARSPASQIVQQAQGMLEQAGDERGFAAALATLDGAINRRGYRDAQAEAERLRAQISGCLSAFQQWQSIQRSLNEKNWTNAVTQLNALMPRYNERNAWVWRKGQAARNRAGRLAGWLDAYRDAGRAGSLDPASWSTNLQKLRAADQALESEKDLAALREALRGRLAHLEGLVKSWDALSGAMQQLARTNADLNPCEPLRTLGWIFDNVPELHREIEPVLPVVERLAAAYGQLTNAFVIAQAMRFKEVLDLSFNLPPAEQCAKDPNLSSARNSLESQWVELRTQVSTLHPRANELTKRLQTLNSLPDELQYWTNLSVLRKIFDCDSLDLPIPKRSRTEGQGEYDQALNIEWFYYALNDPESVDELDKPKWKTRLEAARETVIAARKFRDFFQDGRNQWWLQTKTAPVAQWEAAAERILAWRDRVATGFRQRARESSGREALIALGIAWQLTDSPDQELLVDLKSKFKEVRNQVRRLEAEKLGKPPSESIALRDKIIKTGLPGDPTVRAMWNEVSPAGGAAGR